MINWSDNRTRKYEKEDDWCSFWFEGRWFHCCKRHDRAFDKQLGFFRSNWRLFKCVTRRNRLIARIMMAGVSFFGWIPYIKARIKRKR